MSNTFYYGKPVKEKILNEIRDTIRDNGRIPKCIIIQVGDNVSSNVYISNKLSAAIHCGIHMEHIKFPLATNTMELVHLINKYNNDNSIDGIFVQLPLPRHIHETIIANAIKPSKDVDGFNVVNQGAVVTDNKIGTYIPCTPLGILELLDYYNETVEGKDIVIVGRSNIVGKPLANLLINKGATVTVCHTKTKKLKRKTKNADIVILATGQLKSFDSTYFENGQLIIDVGIGRDENNKLCGDLNIDEVTTTLDELRIVPSPGGCGQTTVAALMKNIYKSRDMK